jgi:cell division protein FtsB
VKSEKKCFRPKILLMQRRFILFFFVILHTKRKKSMKKMKSLLLRIYHIPALKYIVVALIAVVLIGFVDENSVWSHLRNKQRISELEGEIEQYTERWHQDQEKIRTLDSDPKAIEKIARERYFMKADDEDVFVLSDDEKSDLMTPDETAQ